MYTTPQKRSAYSISRSSPLKGHFQDGVWHCNCTPRLPASHFQVKKEGPNTGRWFYTCQEPKESGCGFFLWGEDAAVREKEVVMGNKRSEGHGKDEWRGGALGGKGDRNTVEGNNETSNRFMDGLRRREEDEFGMSEKEERRLVAVVEKEDATFAQDTPSKRRKVEEWATPGVKREWEEKTLLTPVTREGNSTKFGLRSPSYTPTPSRFREGTEVSQVSDAASTGFSPPGYNITGDVNSLLEGHKIDDEVLTDLHKLLDKHALQISGIVKGRDITRLALKKKDEKIAELEKRIGELGHEREMDRKIMGCLRNDMREDVERRSRSAMRGRGND